MALLQINHEVAENKSIQKTQKYLGKHCNVKILLTYYMFQLFLPILAFAK